MVDLAILLIDKFDHLIFLNGVHRLIKRDDFQSFLLNRDSAVGLGTFGDFRKLFGLELREVKKLRLGGVGDKLRQLVVWRLAKSDNLTLINVWEVVLTVNYQINGFINALRHLLGKIS